MTYVCDVCGWEYDEEAGCGNRAFAAAAAGAYGYEAYLAWLDLAGLKAHRKICQPQADSSYR